MKIKLNKLYKICKRYVTEMDEKHSLYGEPIAMFGDTDKIDNKIYQYLMEHIRDYFTKNLVEENSKEPLSLGGDWMTYEWMNYIDQVHADERMKKLPRLYVFEKLMKNFKKYPKKVDLIRILMNRYRIFIEFELGGWSTFMKKLDFQPQRLEK